MNRDLTVGKPERVLWQFCLPLFGSILFQQLYNIADSLVAGKFVGESALAAVGNSYEITLIFIAFAFGCNMGCSVVVSSFFGAKDYSRMKTAVSTAMIASAVVCGLLMVFGLLGGGWLLRLIHTPQELMADSLLYLNIYVLGLPFVFFYNLSTGIFSAMGDSKTPFWFLAASSTANIAVDILFVTVFRMGVAGVAWATFLCQGVSCVLALTVIMRRLRGIETPGRPARFNRTILQKFMRIAIPSVLQQSFISVGNIIIQSVINGFGGGVIAGYAAGVKLNNLVITSFTTLCNGISNYTAQNLGAGKRERIREGFRAGIKIVWTLGLPLALLYFFAGEPLIRFFIDQPSQTAIDTGVTYLRILAPFYFVVSAKLVADGVLRGAELMNQFMIGTFTDLILRVVLAVILSKTSLGATGIWCAWPIGWCTAAVLSIRFCLTKMKG
ncbi:MAG: MATE family efflux transporter [Lachnospiraceae bacterium]|nr:MATE family efflux transporter [Lachnospiraceae bacterium]